MAPPQSKEKKGKGKEKETGSSNKKGHGFRVGPSPKSVSYTGRAQKIKRNLIEKAKVKKEYSKVLKSEGYEFNHNNSTTNKDSTENPTKLKRRQTQQQEPSQHHHQQQEQPKKKLSKQEIESLKQQKETNRKEWGKKGKSGQPNMAARIQVLANKLTTDSRYS